MSKGLTGLISYTLGEALTDSPDHISTSGGGAGIDTGTFREPQDSYNLKAERGPAEFDVRHRFVASYVWELPFGKGQTIRRRMEFRDRFRTRRLAGDRHPCAAKRARVDGDTRWRVGAQPRRRAPGASESRRRSRAARVGADDSAVVQHRRVLAGVQSVAAGVRKCRRRHHARSRLREFRFHVREGFSSRRPAADPVPHRDLQRVQPGELRAAEHRARFHRASARFSRPETPGSSSSG